MLFVFSERATCISPNFLAQHSWLGQLGSLSVEVDENHVSKISLFSVRTSSIGSLKVASYFLILVNLKNRTSPKNLDQFNSLAKKQD
jgi:hypothetical protein